MEVCTIYIKGKGGRDGGGGVGGIDTSNIWEAQQKPKQTSPKRAKGKSNFGDFSTTTKNCGKGV